MKKIHRFECERLRIDRGGYDPSGRYWGKTSQDVYRVEYFVPEHCEYRGTSHTEYTEHFRADDKNHARRKVLNLHPDAVATF